MIPRYISEQCTLPLSPPEVAQECEVATFSGKVELCRRKSATNLV